MINEVFLSLVSNDSGTALGSVVRDEMSPQFDKAKVGDSISPKALKSPEKESKSRGRAKGSYIYEWQPVAPEKSKVVPGKRERGAHHYAESSEDEGKSGGG
jgi:hypothetical protein